MTDSVLYWLLETVIHDFNTPWGKTNLDGKVLMASRQLWNLIKEDQIRSCLLGPGLFTATAFIKEKPIKIQQILGALIFDPTEFREDAPIPLVDIINPEVIDPLEKSSVEEVRETIEKMIVARGKVPEILKFAEIRHITGIPEVAVYEEIRTKLKIRRIGGITKSRFILGGRYRSYYEPYVEAMKKGDYRRPRRFKMLVVPEKQFTAFNEKNLTGWIIVELNPTLDPSLDSYSQFQTELNWVLDFIQDNEGAYIY